MAVDATNLEPRALDASTGCSPVPVSRVRGLFAFQGVYIPQVLARRGQHWTVCPAGHCKTTASAPLPLRARAVLVAPRCAAGRPLKREPLPRRETLQPPKFDLPAARLEAAQHPCVDTERWHAIPPGRLGARAGHLVSRRKCNVLRGGGKPRLLHSANSRAPALCGPGKSAQRRRVTP